MQHMETSHLNSHQYKWNPTNHAGTSYIWIFLLNKAADSEQGKVTEGVLRKKPLRLKGSLALKGISLFSMLVHTEKYPLNRKKKK